MHILKLFLLSTLIVYTIAQVKTVGSTQAKVGVPVDSRTPVIAIISQPATTYNGKFPDAGNNWSEVVGSYVDWVQQTGAEAAIIPFDMPWAVLTQVLSQTNGMVLPGGAAELVDAKNNNQTTEYQNRLHSIINWAKKENKEGRYYPVWGTCLGFEELVISFSGNDGKALQDGFNDQAKYHPVELYSDFWKSEFFGKLSVSNTLIKHVFDRPISYYYHSEGIDVKHFESIKALSNNIRILGSSNSDAGRKFGAIFEAKAFPMWFVQFHPEKHQFEKRESYKPMDRSESTIKVMSSFVFKLVELARPRSHVFDQIPTSIQSYFSYYKNPIWSPSKAFERIYMFKNYFGLPKEKPAQSKLQRLLSVLKKNVAKATTVLSN